MSHLPQSTNRKHHFVIVVGFVGKPLWGLVHYLVGQLLIVRLSSNWNKNLYFHYSHKWINLEQHWRNTRMWHFRWFIIFDFIPFSFVVEKACVALSIPFNTNQDAFNVPFLLGLGVNDENFSPTKGNGQKHLLGCHFLFLT